MRENPNGRHDGLAAPSAAAPPRADARGDTRNDSGESTAPLALRPDVEEPLDSVSDASMDSFPASDSPPWMGMRLGPPR